MAQLIPSSHDMVHYTHAVQKKFVEILGKMAQRHSVVPVNTELLNCRKRMKILMDRYARSDFRHTDKEEGAVEFIARWCMVQWGELTGTESNGFVVNRDDLDGRKRPRPQSNPFAPVSFAEQLFRR